VNGQASGNVDGILERFGETIRVYAGHSVVNGSSSCREGWINSPQMAKRCVKRSLSFCEANFCREDPSGGSTLRTLVHLNPTIQNGYGHLLH
jgi:hypothetical protein